MIIIVPYLLCTINVYPIKYPLIRQYGRSLIEDLIYSRYPNIPNGFLPKEEDNYLFNIYNSTKISSKCPTNLNGSSVLFLTFESAGSTYFSSLNNDKNLGAKTPFFTELYNGNRRIISKNHFCLSPLTTPAHIALYFGCYTLPEQTSLSNINLLSKSGYTTIYLTTVDVKLYGLYDVIKAAGFNYILDKNILFSESDRDLLTKGIEKLKEIITDKPFFLHIHSSNCHMPYFIETKFQDQVKEKIFNDKQRFLKSIEQTDFIFQQIYLYLKCQVNDNLLTILSSDHGQAFGEQNYWTHGNGVIKEEINVPLLFYHPKLVSNEIDFSTHFDIFPTILDLLQLDYFNALGYSLFDENRFTNCPSCLLWDGKPSRDSSTCLGLIQNKKKYKLDLLRNTCSISDWNDQQQEELLLEERIYFEGLIGSLAQFRGIVPYQNLNEKLLFNSLNKIKPTILIVTPTIWEMNAIQSVDLQNKYQFLITNNDLNQFEILWKTPFYNLFNSLEKTIDIYRNRIDGVMGTGDFYGSIFASYISSKLCLPGAPIHSLITLSQKYYSRQFQKSIVPECVPNFDLINPFSIEKPKELDYPFFVKPVKGTMSMLAQKVNNFNQLKKSCQLSFRHLFAAFIWYKPFQQLLYKYKHNSISTWNFIGESYLDGNQVTIEGFIQNGIVTIMGIVDSIMYPGTNHFQRFQYPSNLTNSIQNRMIDITIRLMSKSDLNSSCFNVEMFYNEINDTISIIEINPRMSYQFSDLFQRVDGISSFQIQLQLAIDKKNIQWISRNGIDQVAASFVMRLFNDVRVLQIPDQCQMDYLIHLYPGTNIQVLCRKGQRLSDNDQDIGSYRYAIVNMSAQTWDNLYQAYQHVQNVLTFQFSPI